MQFVVSFLTLDLFNRQRDRVRMPRDCPRDLYVFPGLASQSTRPSWYAELISLSFVSRTHLEIELPKQIRT